MISTLLPQRNIGIGPPSTMFSNWLFHSEQISIVDGSYKSPTNMAPDELRQNDLLIPEKFVSMPTKSQICSLISVPLIFKILV